MNSKIFATIASLTLSLVPQTPLRADAVTDWNAITLATLAAMNEARPSPSSRTLAIVHIAIYDAVNSIEHRFSPYAVDAEAARGASPEAAAIAAAYTALTSLYPSQAQSLAETYAKSLAAIRESAAKKKGIAVGEFVAKTILMLRANDGSDATATYNQSPEPGIWRPTPPPSPQQSGLLGGSHSFHAASRIAVSRGTAAIDIQPAIRSRSRRSEVTGGYRQHNQKAQSKPKSRSFG